MTDSQIVDLYWNRHGNAVTETKKKYGQYLFSIANHILSQREDSEECVNDTLLGAWNSIPPHRPTTLSTYLGKITRRLALNRHRRNTAEKRGGTEADLSLEELSDCIPAGRSIDEQLDSRELAATLNRFLSGLPNDERDVFLCRYWYVNSLEEIAGKTGFSVSKIKSMLHRTRLKLNRQLEKEELR